MSQPRFFDVVADQGFELRDMRGTDLNEVVQIERTAQLSPWARLSFEEALTKQYRCRVLEVDGTVAAYHVLSSVLDELHILNIVCAPRVQGQGYGHVLMDDIVQFAESQCLSKLFLEVRASNQVAQNLYQKWGFAQIALRKQYYRPHRNSETREDALVFMRERVDAPFVAN